MPSSCARVRTADALGGRVSPRSAPRPARTGDWQVPPAAELEAVGSRHVPVARLHHAPEMFRARNGPDVGKSPRRVPSRVAA